ncbi:molybdenum-cofactor-assembly chaperone subunit (delta subunit) of nitrate reductase 1 [Candidatus Filomicrobium marinum]|uniref:Molybdenum-cofactor-assembly chaperone subunit (Delta subunit) of nitrate reductase 1 n=1 Tax=Candidatus Filomicrobium marinum TaxID=1608628 RepID=A0A0D6JK35_9HYPH|nr:nitrate reductase molybdenum cofactor assembly chaperone [Candidatus Filomicrobium marinum]CFX58989.1 molybdenum-cofactor-assembly chaperone subunit (delta subunit) of nitrate reductase 1 [Candidatus Filomicrobium marinum]CPR22349.1 molybdenum-cofactor-assembly chaperone subunit (delta subunit) of nitrate reductase 1 [Candidatus Filomicrobium marinum]
MAKTFKVLSTLLSYPTEEIVAAAPIMAGVLKEERLLRPREIKALIPLVEELSASDLYELQERYVLLFDRTRSLSLHLFEHVHGESRDRGQAMVDLKAVYERAGLEISSNELSDYLPLFLEFLATQPLTEALDLVGQPAHIFAALAERLRRRKSIYTAVFDVLAKLAKADPRSAEVRQLVGEPEIDPNDLESLDAAWQDEEVRFGPSADAQCGGDRLIPKLRAGSRPAPGMEVVQPQPRTIITHSGSRSI